MGTIHKIGLRIADCVSRRIGLCLRNPQFAIRNTATLIITAVFLLSCTPTRPVAKIALVAPFEGLYRQSGYTALESMRAAIAESATPDVEVMPLALDGSGSEAQVRRTIQKALRDPSVTALVGPFDLSSARAVDDVIAADGRAWYAPQTVILTDTVEAIAGQVEQSQNLLLVGDSELLALVDAETLAGRLERSVRIGMDAVAVSNQETVIWLGDAAAAADYLVALRAEAPDAPFWLAFNGDTPVFAQRVLRTLTPNGDVATLGPVYWTAWLDEDYTSWAETRTPNTPTAYVTYRATQNVIAQVTGADSFTTDQRLHVFQLQPDGSSQLVAP